MNEAEQFFGDERLFSAVGTANGHPVDEVGRCVLSAVAAFVGDAVRSDDVSLIVLKRV
jgi:serine phosphatase RsbU (regulator of sigma subunit)